MKKQEWKKYTALEQLDNMEMLTAMFFSHAFGRHYHDGYALGVILEGCETYKCNNKVNVAPKGSVVVVNPGEVHNGEAWDRAQGWGYFMIYPHLSLIEKSQEHLGLGSHCLPAFPESVVQDQDVAKGLIRFMKSHNAGDSRLGLETAFLELLHLLISRHAEFKQAPAHDTPEAKKVGKTVDLIHAQFSDPLSLNQLAREVNLSAWALLRLFKKQTGISPYLLQAWLRIQAAKKSLRSGIPMAETAVSCGFSDQSHMTKQFRRWMGITPGDCLDKSATA